MLPLAASLFIKVWPVAGIVEITAAGKITPAGIQLLGFTHPRIGDPGNNIHKLYFQFCIYIVICISLAVKGNIGNCFILGKTTFYIAPIKTVSKFKESNICMTLCVYIIGCLSYFYNFGLSGTNQFAFQIKYIYVFTNSFPTCNRLSVRVKIVTVFVNGFPFIFQFITLLS